MGKGLVLRSFIINHSSSIHEESIPAGKLRPFTEGEDRKECMIPYEEEREGRYFDRRGPDSPRESVQEGGPFYAFSSNAMDSKSSAQPILPSPLRFSFVFSII